MSNNDLFGPMEYYYVSVRNGPKYGLLLGPYFTHAEALANVERGTQLAMSTDNETWTWFYAYGTVKLSSRKKTVFGA